MPEPLLNVMKIMLLAGLYLFFVRVLWSVYNELRDPRTRVEARPGPSVDPARTTTRRATAAAHRASTSRKAVSTPAGGTAVATAARSTHAASADPSGPPVVLVGQLVMLEPPERAGLTWALGNQVTLGRDATCGVQLDDSYVSSIHARIFNTKGAFMIEDLDSRNGTVLNERPLPPSQAMPLEPGSRIRIGATLLEFS